MVVYPLPISEGSISELLTLAITLANRNKEVEVIQSRPKNANKAYNAVLPLTRSWNISRKKTSKQTLYRSIVIYAEEYWSI